MPDFKVGDTVRLNSGGELMTVESIVPPDSVRCEWQDSDSKPHQKIYKAAMLSHDDGTVDYDAD